MATRDRDSAWVCRVYNYAIPALEYSRGLVRPQRRSSLVFAGGIGENAATIRARICEGLGFLALELNESRNAAYADVISADASRVKVHIIRTDEELMIARSVCRIAGLSVRG